MCFYFMSNGLEDLEHDETRRHTDPLFYNRITGETSGTLGQLAKKMELYKYTSFAEGSVVKRVYFAIRKAIIHCVPESHYHAKRETRIDSYLS